jgi:hypothetical protein
VIGLAAVIAVACPATAGAATLIARSEHTDDVVIEGVGCGVPASVVVGLPASATDVRVRAPDVGDTALDARLTEATVLGASVRFTAVGDGPVICDPAEDPAVPPSQRPWSGEFGSRITFRERVSARYWSGRDPKLRTRPRSVAIHFVASVRKIRWRTFGGRRAIGFGRLRADAPPGFTCTRRKCPGHGRRFKVVLSRPSRCADWGDSVWYDRIAFVTTTRVGVIRPGRVFASFDPDCGLSKPKRV